MDLDLFGTKELYSVQLKATFDIEIGGRYYEEGETILAFEELQLAGLDELKERRAAFGGSNGQTLIMWEDTKGIDFVCEKGIVSRLSWAMLSNSKLKNIGVPVKVNHYETKEADENGEIALSYLATDFGFFIYKEDGTKVNVYTKELVEDKIIIGELTPFTNYTFDYNYLRTTASQELVIGERLINGYLSLTAKMRLKDDNTGLIKTGILEIPRIRIMSELSMRLGNNAIPTVQTFKFVGEPVGVRGQKYVSKFIFFEEDLDVI